MTTPEALEFLARHQPMPDDFSISESEGDTFAAILTHFQARPDERCLPLLVGSVSGSTGLGMYQHITFVLQQFALEIVGPQIERALCSHDVGVRRWGVDWALDCPWPGLLPLLQRIQASPEDEDAHERAQAAIEEMTTHTD